MPFLPPNQQRQSTESSASTTQNMQYIHIVENENTRNKKVTKNEKNYS